MRTSKQIQAEIDRLEVLQMKKGREIHKISQRIEKLTNTCSKATHREELEKDGVVVTIVKCEIQNGNYLVTTSEGLSWWGHERLGKKKITRKLYNQIKKCKARNDLAKKLGKKSWDLTTEDLETAGLQL